MRLITGLKLDNPTIKLCHLNLHDRDLLIDIEEQGSLATKQLGK